MKTILIVCAATMLLSVSFSVQADPPDPTPGATKLVREQNLDENGSIAVHEQGVVSVANEDGGELDVNVTGGSIDANISGGSVDANVTNTVTVTGSVEVANFPSTQTVDGTVNVGNFPASQSTKGREYIGSTSLTLPDIGIMAMHAMCDAEFEGSRMCRSSDILRNGGDMASLHDDWPAWVQPDLVAGAIHERPENCSHGDCSVLDASGVYMWGYNAPAALSCHAWSSSSDNGTGLVLEPNGTFGQRECNENTPTGIQVACCMEVWE